MDKDVPFDDDKQKALFAFWDNARGENLLPVAADIDPSQIVELLNEIAIFDVFSATDIQYRLAGTEIVERMGNDPTGKNLLDITAPNTRTFVSDLFRSINNHPAGAIVHYENTYNTGKRAPVRSLFLPIAANPNGNPRVLSIHTRDAAMAYENEQPATTIGTGVEETIWIDIGAGIPKEDQADG